MAKHYRVRSQEQWDWLANKLNIYCVKSMGCPVIIEHEQGRKYYNIFQYYGGFEPVIEVSQMMEDEKMEDYVTIKNKDLGKLLDENNEPFLDEQTETGKYIFTDPKYVPQIKIPKSMIYRKVKMTEAEKAEFDKLNKEWTTLYLAINAINDEFLEYPLLLNRLFRRMTSAEDNEAQIEFARAWADPSLIEVVKEPKFNVKVPVSKGRDYYEKYSTVKEDNLVIVGTLNSLRELLTNTEFQFTESELKEYGLDDDMYEKEEVKDDEI